MPRTSAGDCMLHIPHTRLSPEVLRALLEAFVTREGTDYGPRDVSLQDKVAHVRRQLERGETVITYDEVTRSCTLVIRETLPKSEG